MSDSIDKTKSLLAVLQDPFTIRQQAHKILQLAKEDKLAHFKFNPERLLPTAHFVIDIIKQNYPKLDVPYHSRWRHFEIDNRPRVEQLLDSYGPLSSTERGKILYELIIVSVFLDAGAGNQWHYIEPGTNKNYSRSEGLAIASLEMYKQGIFSASAENPFRVDAAKLINLNEDDLKNSFQVNTNNPLEGLNGRVSLLNKLGTLLQEKQDYFGKEDRLGDFYTHVCSLQKEHQIMAKTLFQAVLSAFNDMWPKRLSYQGISLGDVWTHSAFQAESGLAQFIPFHKLSQWLTYSLMEPLELAGIQVNNLDELTGLPEYRNGGLMIDSGLISAKDSSLYNIPQQPDSEAIVEWRALTVALLDELAQVIRKQLQLDAQTLPLAKILQGGTWAAGRMIAKEKRLDGAPPIQIISDGTLF